MANEVTVPLLPCRSIDEIAGFYAVLGFEQTYRQTRTGPGGGRTSIERSTARPTARQARPCARERRRARRLADLTAAL